MRNIFKYCNYIFGGILITFGLIGALCYSQSRALWVAIITIGILGIVYQKDITHLKETINKQQKELDNQHDKSKQTVEV